MRWIFLSSSSIGQYLDSVCIFSTVTSTLTRVLQQLNGFFVYGINNVASTAIARDKRYLILGIFVPMKTSILEALPQLGLVEIKVQRD